MAAAYVGGAIFGMFIAGCFFGLFPLIVGLVKKRPGAGVLWMCACGLCAFIQPVLSILVAIVSGIVLICMKKQVKTETPAPSSEPVSPAGKESGTTILPEEPAAPGLVNEPSAASGGELPTTTFLGPDAAKKAPGTTILTDADTAPFDPYEGDNFFTYADRFRQEDAPAPAEPAPPSDSYDLWS